ncbi:hypothetical protein [Fluoribacter gormanii]|uniref:Substrate of the Dot/Icm secretion system n=1 Tax=Fluoribacter gormanii TaxID=464 RepID=A0A377GJP9_9GAMM|nr:hypothetical protein [Fluoribacter gormanii]KTD03524.1 substrate of the Dot/Icm secretion system [Fluoribacter gormanii]SIQ44554.1 hypothetical protein SAMN05421777_10153 [Fluoribacter gormanii]STO24552.1 Uncharacterised protein [Fluoribacter gormanii]
MTYIPPTFAKFRVNTLNLETKYSTILGRYTVVDGQVSDGLSSPQQSSLDVLIARTNEVIKCKSDRIPQIEVFNQLVNELRQIPKENKRDTEQGALFLLGALIHRYFRLIKEYDNFNYYASWTIWGKCNVTDCKLFQAIRRALKFKELDSDLIKKTFRVDDLKTLDVVTIVKALEVFRNNMLLEDKEKVPRFMKYPHFAEDRNFKSYLQDIIDEHARRGAAILNRFTAIEFIKTLAEQIENERQQLEKDIEKWCKGVAKDYKDFNVFKNLDEEAINLSLIKHIESETSRNIIFSLFYTPLIQDNLEFTDHSSFLTKMKACYDSTCSYMLFGGYVLLLKQSKILDTDLLFTIQQALGLEVSLDELTKEDMLNGVKFLKQFLDTEPGASLDCTFFNGKDKMLTAIARAEKELTMQDAPKKEEGLVLTY